MRAQIAANQKGAQELRRLAGHFGLDVVQAYMKHVQDNDEQAVRQVITALKDGSLESRMDIRATIRHAIKIDQEQHHDTRAGELWVGKVGDSRGTHWGWQQD